MRGVIAAEMPADLAGRALKVQAVAARTYAITSSVEATALDLYPDTRSQMYGGVAAETAADRCRGSGDGGPGRHLPRRPGHHLLLRSSGGHTENVENVWPGATPEPWLAASRIPTTARQGPLPPLGLRLLLAAAASKLAVFKGGFSVSACPDRQLAAHPPRPGSGDPR